MRSRKRRRKDKFGRVFILLLVAGLLAVSCGWLINTLIVQGYLWAPTIAPKDPVVQSPPVSNPPSTGQPTTPSVTESKATLRSFRFYLVQVGALSNESSARNLVKQLENQGYPGSFAKEGNFYKVYAGIYPEKAAAEAAGKMLQQLKHSVFVKESSLPGVDSSVTGSLATYFAAAGDKLATLDAVFGDCLEASAIDQSKIADLKQRSEAARQALSALSPPSELTSFHTALLDASAWLVTTTKQMDEYLRTNNELSLLLAESSLMEFTRSYQTVHSIICNILT